jgi:hypothetical protein
VRGAELVLDVAARGGLPVVSATAGGEREDGCGYAGLMETAPFQISVSSQSYRYSTPS